MAVDTRDKRGSVFNILNVPRIYPNPDNDLDNASDRVHMAYLYRLAASDSEIKDRMLLLMRVGDLIMHWSQWWQK